MNIKELTIKYAAEMGFSVSEEKAEAFSTYAELLKEWNQKINLTALTEDEEIAVKHFTDSLTILKYLPKKDFSIIDVGTGAGFPGIPIKIMNQNANVTLLDSLNKRIKFLNIVADALSISVKTIHGRAEELGRDEKYREQFDFATARAVANLSSLCEYTLPFVKPGGSLIAMKGSKVKEEIKEVQAVLPLLSAQIEEIDSFYLPDGSERNIIVIKKISQLSPKYPRRATKISKNPL